jgi:hypothetical protein
VLWGALAQRLTRDIFQGKGPATDSKDYQVMGNRVHNQLAFSYFYPTTHPDSRVSPWPWEEGFRPRFLSTYASTALAYPQQSAAEGTLHEVEFISPYTLDVGKQVYLVGYIFARDDAPDWQSALRRLQLGGERGYGWGRVELVGKPEEWNGQPLFHWYTVEPNTWPPVLKARENASLLAHALAVDFEDKTCPQKDGTPTLRRCVEGISGPVEPLVGRETHPQDGRFGVWLSQARICYIPGSMVSKEACFKIGPYGIWEGINDSAT